MKKQETRFTIKYEEFLAIVLMLVIWEVLARVIHQNILLVGPWQVVKRLLIIWREDGFFRTLFFSLGRMIGGFFLGMISGTVLAILAGSFRIVRVLLKPWVATIKSVPVASFVVICLIWLSGNGLTVFISFLVTLPVIYQNVLTGFLQKNADLEDTADVLHIYGMPRIRYVVLPQIFPYFMAGAKTAAGMAFRAGIAAEIIGTPNGSVGRELHLARIYLDTDGLLAWTVILVVCSVIFEKILVRFLGLIKKKLMKI